MGGPTSDIAKSGLKATRFAGSTKRDLAEWNIAERLFRTREAPTRGKTSISGAPILIFDFFRG